MPYATRTDLAERYGEDELEQRESMLAEGAVDRALTDADAEIDSYVTGNYAVPLSPVPANIVRVACSIARYRLLGDAATEQARKDYEDAVRFLRDVQAGRAALMAAAPVGSGAAGLAMVVNGRDKAFGGGVR